MSTNNFDGLCGACRANNHIADHLFTDGCHCACHTGRWVEAEREGWYWTNPDHTEARDGRFVATIAEEVGDPHWSMSHDDFPGCVVQYGTGGTVGAWVERAQWHFDSFLTWLTDQGQPSEPEPTSKQDTQVATVTVRLDLTALADDLQAAADILRPRIGRAL
jgi:hypothetical protein